MGCAIKICKKNILFTAVIFPFCFAVPVFAEPALTGADEATPQSHVFFAENGRPVLEGSFLNGRKHGEFKEYADNGRLIWRGSYVNGRLHGLVEKWHADGQLAARWEFENGRAVGVAENYSQQGMLEERWDFSQTSCSGDVAYMRFEAGSLIESGSYVDKSLQGALSAEKPRCGWASVTRFF